MPSPSIDHAPATTEGWTLVGLAVAALAGVFAARRAGLFAAPRRPATGGPTAPETMLLLAVGLYAVGPLAFTSAAALGLAPADPAAATRGELARGAAIAYLAQGALALLVLRRACAPPPARTPAAHAGTGALALVASWPAAAFLAIAAGLLLERLGAPAPPIAHDTLRLLVEGPKDASFFGLAALVVIAAPLVEETLYRGLLQAALGRLLRARWAALVATSVLFAAMHASNTAPNGLVALLVISLGFGWAYERSGSLLAPMTAHALFNAGNLLLATLGT